jgi:arginine/ornithine transport system substrate-binding protein
MTLHRLLVPTFLALAAATAAAQAPLRVGVEAAYPPFSELGPDGQLKGFDIDIAHEVCKRLGTRCEFVKTEFDAMIPALRAKKFDAIVASMSITPERMKSVDFSIPYYSTPARIVARKDATFDGTPEGLKGKRLGVQRTTIHDRYATAKFGGATITRYAKQDEIFLDLLSGRLDASLADSVAIDQGFLKTPQGKDFGFRGPAYTDPAFFGDGAGIAMRKGDDALRTKINAALAGLRADGTYKAINDRYFAFDIYGPEPAKKK